MTNKCIGSSTWFSGFTIVPHSCWMSESKCVRPNLASVQRSSSPQHLISKSAPLMTSFRNENLKGKDAMIRLTMDEIDIAETDLLTSTHIMTRAKYECLIRDANCTKPFGTSQNVAEPDTQRELA